MKKVTSIFMAVVLTIAFSIPVFAVQPSTQTTDFTGKTVILHTNDSHSRVEENMGFAGVSALKKEYEKAGATVLLLDAGDTLHGLPFATVEEGESIVSLMNMVGYDAMTPGNHDFNYGYQRLLELAEMANFPILSANCIKDDKTILPENTIIEKNGIRYGIFGLSTPETATATNPKNIEGITFENPVAAAEKQIAALEAENVDHIIAISHLGTAQASEYTSKRVAEETKGIDVIIDGHSHTVLENGLTVGDTLIASTGEYINSIGVVVLDEEGNKEAFLVNAETFSQKDEDVVKYINDEKANQDTLLSEVVTTTSVDLDGTRNTVRTKESNFGNLVCDAFLAETGADVAILNGGTIRDSIKAGDITQKDLITVFPFGNYVVTKEVSGAVILQALEEGFAGYPDEVGAFPQIAGMKVQFDPSKEVGERVVSVEIDGKELDENTLYVAAVNDFVASGGDYTEIQNCKTVGEYSSMIEIIVDYMENTDLSKYATTDGRLTMIETAMEQETATEQETTIEQETVTVQQQKDQTPVTRGEVVEMILEKAENESLKKEDIIKGYGTQDGDLKEQQPITKIECIVMIDRAFADLPKTEESVSFTVAVPQWAEQATNHLINAGIITQPINPQDTMTKTEVEAMLDDIVA